MLRGSTPIQLQQLDISPAIQAGALEQQAITNMYSGIQQGIQNFQEKQEKKQQNEMTVNALKQFVPGLGDDVYKAISKDPQILKSMSDLTNIQAAQQEQEILGQEMAKREEQESILEKAIMPNTDTSGLIDKEGVKRTFIQLGGTDESVLGLFNTPGEIRISDKGVITQDGLYKGQVATELLDIEPTQGEKEKSKLELKKRQAEIDKLNAEIAKIKGEIPTTEFDPEKLEGIDKEAYDYAIDNPGTSESEEILKRLRAK